MFQRRQILKSGLAAAPAFLMGRSALAAKMRANQGAGPQTKLLTIFLRGGNDALNTFIPIGDTSYFNPGGNPQNPSTMSVRPNVYIPDPIFLNKGGNGVALHPSLQKLAARFDDPTRDEVALIHRIGYEKCLRSHFTEMHKVETGYETFASTKVGWLPKVMAEGGLLGTGSNPLAASSITDRLQRLYMTDGQDGASTNHFAKPYGLPDGANTREFLLSLNDTPGTDRLTHNLDQSLNPFVGMGSSASMFDGVNKALRETMDGAIRSVQELPSSFQHNPSWFPLNGSPQGNEFAERVEVAVEMLVNPDLKMNNFDGNCTGLELGGFDTHQNQVDNPGTPLDHKLGDHADLLKILDDAIEGACLKFEAANEDYLIIVISEFGRTVVNNITGTDHGVAGGMIAVGNCVRGGFYNCHIPNTGMTRSFGDDWINCLETTPRFYNTATGTNPTFGHSLDFYDALVPATDIRVPFVEIARKIFGLDGADMDLAVPPLSGSSDATWQQIDSEPWSPAPNILTPLNFLT